MSFAATIMARLGVDVKPFSTGMREANKDVDVHERKVNNAARAHENLLRSSHRVARQISNTTRDLLLGGNAADIFANGLESVGKSLNLSLGALAAIGVGAVAIQQIYKLHEEFEKVNSEVEKLLKSGGNADFNTLTALEKHLSSVADQIERLNKESKGGISQSVKDAFGENFFTDEGELLPDSGKANRRRARQIAELESKQDADQRSIATKRHRQNARKGDPYGAFDINQNEEFIDAVKPGGNGYLAAEIAEELKKGMLDLIHTIISKADEKVKFSLADLAAIPGQTTASDGISFEKWQNGQLARQVQQLEATAKQQASNFDFEGAKATNARAEQLRGGISGLKDSEKTHEFQDALDASQRLKNIETNTGGMFAGR